MALFLRKYFWAVNLATIALCSLLAAHGLGRVVMANVPRAPIPPPRRVRAQLAEAFAPPEIGAVVERNIFCSDCEPEPLTEPGAEEPGAGQAPSTPLSLKLIATLVSPVEDQPSYAAIRDPDEGDTRLYGIGSSLPGEAVVTDIADRTVTVERGGRVEQLSLEQEQGGAKQSSPRAPQARGKQPRPRRGMERLARAIHRLGPKKWQIERSALNSVLSNPTTIARSARIVPSTRNGKPNGFRLFAIRRGSLYSLLGMFNGDTIKAVNGHPITTPDKALSIYTKLRSASHVTISFTRRGTPITHEYVIR